MKRTNKKASNIMNTKSFKAASKRVMNRAHEIKSHDSSYVWSECLKMAWVEEKSGKLNVSKRASSVAAQLQIAMIIDKKVKDVKTLSNCKRNVLIAIMKEIGVSKWYRIYDKGTMVEKIIEKFAA